MTEFVSKFATEEKALARLIYNKKPDCVDTLEKGFWQARGEGLGIREAYHRAEFVHYIQDHDGLNHGEGDNLNAKTDEDIRALAQVSLETALAAGEEEAQETHRDMLYWYDQFRHWGGDVYLSHIGSIRVASELWYERHDAPEDEVLGKLKGIKSEPIREAALEAYNTYRGLGETVMASGEHAEEAAQRAALYIIFGGA